MRGEQLYESAQRHLIGGAGAGGRYHPLLKRPLYLARGHGSRFWDVDGKEYIDFFTGSGANFLGHDHPAIRAAIQQALEVGVICNGETEYHSRLAEMISEAVPCAEKVRFANSGTEATMGAIRIARGYTAEAQDPQVRGPLPRHARLPLVQLLGRGRRGARGRHGRAPARFGRDARGAGGPDRGRALQRPRRLRAGHRAPTGTSWRR